MHRYTYGVATFVLALTMSVLPAAALAKDSGTSGGSNMGGSGSGNANSGVRVELQGIEATAVATTSASPASRSGEGKNTSGDLQKSGDMENGTEATSSNEGEGNANENINGNDQNEVEGIHLELESTTTLAHSSDELKQTIEKRKTELDDEAASTTPDNQDIVKSVNPARVALRGLLTSKALLGADGQKVADIAEKMNSSVATTTDAEVEIHSRGFFTRLFFGGDSTAASVIATAVAENQTHIDELTTLLNAANVAADVKATLIAQISVLQDAQARLTALAAKEQSAWGIFSWRF